MRFSIWPSPMRPWAEILELDAHCEAAGWDGVYFADHFMPNAPDTTRSTAPTLECWSVIAGLAAAVPRLRLAPLVTSVTYRHPAVLANIAAAVDNISHGRLLLGLGAGWQENEHAAYGIELGSIKERLDRFEEACDRPASSREAHNIRRPVLPGDRRAQPAGAGSGSCRYSSAAAERNGHAHRRPLRRRVERVDDS